MGYGPITHFTDIEAWKLARKLRMAVYGVIKELPTEERYNLASHILYPLSSILYPLSY